MTLSDVLRSRIETVGADAGALLHLESGVCLETISGPSALLTKSLNHIDDTQTTTLAADARATAQIALAMLQLGDVDETLDEIVTMAANRYEISQQLKTSANAGDHTNLLLYLRFDTARVSPAMARHRLSAFERLVTLDALDQERLAILSSLIAFEEPNEAEATTETSAALAAATAKAATVVAEPVAPAVEVPEITEIGETPESVDSALPAMPAGITEPPVIATDPAAMATALNTASPSANALARRGNNLKEQEEYRYMNADSIRWLKEMKKLLMDWTRTSGSANETQTVM